MNERLTALIDGELSPAEQAEVERALSQDPALQAEYDELLAAVDFVREHGPVDAPAGFHAAVMSATEELPMPGGFLRRITRFFREMPVETLAVAVAALLVAIVIGSPADEPTPARVAEAPAANTELPQPALLPPAAVDAAPETERVAAAQGSEASSAPKRAPPVATEDRQQLLSELVGPEAGEGGMDGMAAIDPGEASAEQGAASGSGEVGEDLREQLVAPVSLSLRSADPQALLQLQQLAERLGGELIDRSTGAPMDAHRLQDGEGKLSLSARIPGDRVSEFSQGAARIGELRVTSQRGSALYGGGRIEVILDLSYTGGAAQ
ncbi:MAG: hypothetical protein H6741_09800 [Alphaproteobacteria bacterium]|nr:hypothetical protein [Alphaproteobacteria bacterium]MCB9793005.1 hypothetical protein [Alphaproteobacteria bacterium]